MMLGVCALLLVLLLVNGRAWACIPQPFIVLEPGYFGGSGSEVVVHGARFAQADIEVRWDSLDGPMLATANDNDFSVGITIPNDPPGLYVVLVIARAPGGAIDSVQRALFQVTERGELGGDDGRPSDETTGASGGTSTWRLSPSLAVMVGAVTVGLLGLGGLCAVKLLHRREE
jgi:hypothetical protein